jgi:LemA protein
MQGLVSLFIMFIFLAVCALAVAGFFAVTGYNALQSQSQFTREAFSNIQIMLKKRFELLNRLMDLVKGYSDHESLVYLKVSQDRNQTGTELAESFQQSRVALAQVMRVAESYPQIKADGAYRQMMYDLQQIEGELQFKREVYNGKVREYNTNLSTIPTVFYAKPLGFSSASFLEFDNAEGLHQIKDFSNDDGARLHDLIKGFGGKAKSAAIAAGQAVSKARSEIKHAQRPSGGGKKFYYTGADNKPTGPVFVEELEKMCVEGNLSVETFVIPEDGTEWIPYRNIRPRSVNNLPPVPPPSFQG